MTWIRVDSGLPQHRKVAQVARTLRTPRGTVVGVLVGCWAYSDQYHPDGDITSADWHHMTEWAGYTRPDDLKRALLEAGWIDVSDDGRWTWHDWSEHQGGMIRRREKDRTRKRHERESKGRPVDVRRTEEGQPQDVHTERTERTERTDGEDGRTEIGSAAWSPEQRSAAVGYRRNRQDPEAFDAIVRSVADGMPGHGPGFGWPTVGQALLEMRGSNAEFSQVVLLAFCRRVRDRKPERPPVHLVSNDKGVMQPAVKQPDGSWRYLTEDEARALGWTGEAA